MAKWSAGLNGLVFAHELSYYGFEFRCSHTILKILKLNNNEILLFMNDANNRSDHHSFHFIFTLKLIETVRVQSFDLTAVLKLNASVDGFKYFKDHIYECPSRKCMLVYQI